MARTLITGAAGFVGSHLAAAAVAAAHQVHVIARPSSDVTRLEALGERVVRHRLDLRDDAALRRCVADVRPTTVFHLAASPRRPETAGLDDVSDFVREDLEALVLLLRTLGEGRRPPSVVVRTGSLAEYGTATPPHREEQREQPVTAYSAALVAATQLVSGIQARLAFPVVTARLALVFGPAQSTGYFVPHLISRCLDGSAAEIRRPDDRRDFIFVGDVVAALLRLAAAADRPPVINISTGMAPRMRDVAEMIVDLTGADPSLVKLSRAGVPNGAAHLRCSPELAARVLGWRAETTLAAGLTRTVAWFRRNREPRIVAIPTVQARAAERSDRSHAQPQAT